MSMIIQSEYEWDGFLCGKALDNFEALEDVFGTYYVISAVEAVVGHRFDSEDEAYDTVCGFLEDLPKAGEKIAEHLGVTLTDEQKASLKMFSIDPYTGRKYRVVDEDPHQGLLFHVENPKRRIWLDD